MLHGELVGLRARIPSDVEPLHTALYDDVALHSRIHGRPWRPISPGTDSPYGDGPKDDAVTVFSVVELATGDLAGDAVLWGIDTHNRMAHLGLALLPKVHGRGLGADAVAVLCHFGFIVRGLHRLQLETLADNAAMIGAAEKNGFILEGRTRRGAWVNGEFADEVTYGQLADEWRSG